MSRINTYPEADSLNQDDFLVIDGATDGTRKVKGCLLDNGPDIDITFPSLSLTTGAYINKNGVISSGNSFSYSAPIAVSAGDRVSLTAAGYSTNVAMISTCDANGSSISPKVKSIDADVHEYIYDVIETGYVRVCFHHRKYYSTKIYGSKSNIKLYQSIKSIEYAIDNNFVKPVNNVFEQGTWRNGSKNTDSYAIRFVDGYQIVNYSQIIIKANGQYFYLYVYANRTENGGTISFSNIIKTVTWQNTDATIDAPEGSWVVLVVRKTYPSNTTIRPIENAVQMYIADNQIIKNKGDIIDLAEKVEEIVGNIPEYWETAINNAIDTVLTNRLSIGNKISEFFFITDIHWSGNAKNSPKLINHISKETGIYDVFVGGDVIYTHDNSKFEASEELRDFYKQFNQNLRIFSTIGNHDLNSNNNSDANTYLSPEQLYCCMMKSEEKYIDTNASPYVTTYDNDSQKIRYIQFYHPDVIAISSDVKNAVINAIEEKGSDWTVLIMCHVYWSTGNAVDSYIAGFTEELSVISESENYARIAALIVGHMHYDSSTIVNNNLLVIASQCDIYRQTSGSEMTLGTNTEQAFDIFQIDTQNRSIYITRVGSGNNRTFTY